MPQCLFVQHLSEERFPLLLRTFPFSDKLLFKGVDLLILLARTFAMFSLHSTDSTLTSLHFRTSCYPREMPSFPGKLVMCLVSTTFYKRRDIFSVPEKKSCTLREGIKKKSTFLGNSPKQQTPPTHRYGLGLT